MRVLLLAIGLTCLLPCAAWAQDEAIAGKSVADWLAILDKGGEQVRLKALAALGEAGSLPEPIVKELAKLLRDSQATVRRAAAQVLSQLGAEAVSATPALARALGSRDPALRELAAGALEKIGAPAVPALAKMLDDADAWIRLFGVLGLDCVGLTDEPSVKALGFALADKSVTIRRTALVALVRRGVGEPLVQPLVEKAVHDKDRMMHAYALKALAGLGREATGPLVKALVETTAPVRLAVLHELIALAEFEEESIPALRKHLADADFQVKIATIFLLAKLGTKAREFGGGKELYDDLARLLTDRDARIRQAAALAMGHVGVDEQAEIVTLAQGLKDADFLVRVATLQALSQYAFAEAPEEIRTEVYGNLIAGLRDKDKRVQNMAGLILVQQAEQAVPSLIAAVEKGEGKTQTLAMFLLGEIGPAAAAGIPALEKQSKQGTPENKQVALAALKKIGP